MLQEIKVSYSTILLIDSEGELDVERLKNLIESELDNAVSDNSFPSNIKDVSVKSSDCYVFKMPMLSKGKHDE